MKPIQLLMFFLVSPLLAQGSQNDSITFFSPSKKIKIIFARDTEAVYENSGNIGEVSYIRYRLLILNSIDSRTITQDYYDVYGNHSPSKPTAPSAIFSLISWSPAEDFIELPEPDWSRAPGAPERPVVNLNKKFNWTIGTITIYHNFWLDNLRVIGDHEGDCGVCVEMFDGSTGKMVTIKDSQSPIGYRIESTANDTMFVKSILDNCSGNEDEAKFKPQTLAIPFSEIRKLMGKN